MNAVLMAAIVIIALCAVITVMIAGIGRMRRRIEELIGQKSRAEAVIGSLREQAASEREELERIRGSFRIEFQNLANEILEQKSKQFKESNKESMEALLKPFRENIADFRERVEKIYSAENQQRGELKNELRNLLDLNRSITEQTTNLTNALKGSSKVQGDWGEMILETILDGSNLVGGIHYSSQQNIRDEEGNSLRPDVVLHLPEKRDIVIDSKVSLKSFVEYMAAEEQAAADAAIRGHLLSIRRHIDELGSKRYQNLLNSPDFVIMFIPNEPAFLAAMQADSSIWSDAYNRKVIISSPTNLFALLKIVDDMWRRDNQSKNALEIARAGGDLYDKFVGFVESMGDIGRNIEAAQRNFDKAMGQLSSGKGNLVSRTEKLREMGVKASKSIPSAIADKACGDD